MNTSTYRNSKSKVTKIDVEKAWTWSPLHLQRIYYSLYKKLNFHWYEYFSSITVVIMVKNQFEKC